MFNDLIQQAAPQVITEVILAVVALILGWIGVLYQRVTGHQIDAKHQASLQSALTNGLMYGIAKLFNGKIPTEVTPEVMQQLQALATDYVTTSVPDAVAHFKLTPWEIGTLLLPKIPPILSGLFPKFQLPAFSIPGFPSPIASQAPVVPPVPTVG